MSKEQIYKMVATAVTALLTCLAIALGLSSCNVTRTITTRSEAWQKGDTSVVIQTKTRWRPTMLRRKVFEKNTYKP